MAENTRVVELIVGHSSTRLNGKQDNGHTHQWTLFVKPVNRDYDDFPDNKLIQKVKFQIHESFPNPIRNVSKPPFKISETGFASFSTYVTVYLNLPNEKPHTIPYELNLFTGDQDVQEEIQKLVIRGEVIPQPFADQVKRYCKTKKRKSSIISPNDQKSPPRKVKKEKSLVYEHLEKGKQSSSKKSIKAPRIEFEKPLDSPGKRKDEKLETAEELTKKLNECSDPYVIYKVSEYLLTLPNTTLSSTTLRLSFDLGNSSQGTLSEISRLMKSTKKSKA